jgi:hypothetical protein
VLLNFHESNSSTSDCKPANMSLFVSKENTTRGLSPTLKMRRGCNDLVPKQRI